MLMRPHRPPSYDSKAVAFIDAIERILQRLHPERQGEFIAILNAITYDVEEGTGHPTVLCHLEDALLAMADVVHLDARATAAIKWQLDALHHWVVRKSRSF